MNSCLVGLSTVKLGQKISEFSPGNVLGSAFTSGQDTFFYVLDEAQVAGQSHVDAFSDVNGKVHQPVLRPIIGAWSNLPSESVKFIVSGTGFSLSLFQTVLTSGVGKASFESTWKVVHRTGDFTIQNLQKAYIYRYLPPTFLSSPSGVVLLSRMYEWLRGR